MLLSRVFCLYFERNLHIFETIVFAQQFHNLYVLRNKLAKSEKHMAQPLLPNGNKNKFAFANLPFANLWFARVLATEDAE